MEWERKGEEKREGEEWDGGGGKKTHPLSKIPGYATAELFKK